LISGAFSPETKITGVDPFEEALAGARKQNFSPNVSFIRMEGEHLAFADASFDVVSMSNAMHHLASVEETFAEMKRVVKPEGWLLIAEIVSDGLNEAQENQKMVHHLRSLADRKEGITHQETWTEAEVLEIIRGNGILPELVFEFNRMSGPETDPAKLQEWVKMFEGHLARLVGHPEYTEKAQLLDVFKQRLNQFGFQLARQVVVIGKAGK
jgi:SAM-dependent methyltransferase